MSTAAAGFDSHQKGREQSDGRWLYQFRFYEMDESNEGHRRAKTDLQKDRSTGRSVIP
jgi:hypothetical protein